MAGSIYGKGEDDDGLVNFAEIDLLLRAGVKNNIKPGDMVIGADTCFDGGAAEDGVGDFEIAGDRAGCNLNRLIDFHL